MTSSLTRRTRDSAYAASYAMTRCTFSCSSRRKRARLRLRNDGDLLDHRRLLHVVVDVVPATEMTCLIESIKKEPVMTMTLKCDTEFPKALKNIMESMGLKGEAVYKGFPVMDDGQEYWWVQLHLYKDEEDDPKKMEHWMFTNPELHTSFFDSARCVAWAAINELGERLKYRLHNTQKDLKEEKEETANLNTTVGRLRSDMVELSLKLGMYEELNKAKDSQIATLGKRMLMYSGSS
ncbi:hypothetical protein QYE76_068794 [Lolium multiflorum]|uniref:Uncharacterized protein n=1 Tax=Lolium multiflorum TaxID=4521 RepID=A0AAD8WEA6_LOLMU|nr:hypothetical protein QYE76_068794 [Lolium multiflorum]